MRVRSVSTSSAAQEPVTQLRTKLYRPPARDDLLPRPRLLKRLEGCTECKLTLVSVAAGTGKTTLLLQWLEACDRPAAWPSLDASDNDLVVFVSHVIAALQAVFPRACSKTLSLLQAPQLPPSD